MPAALILRADASSQLGTGHVMRCLALGAAWRAAGGDVTLVSYCPAPALQQRIAQSGIRLVLVDRLQQQTQHVVSTLREVIEGQPGGADEERWVALDGYHYPAACQRAVKRLGCRLLVIDDLAQHGTYQADVLLNQNLGAEQYAYRCPARCARLLGPQYALLRPEFQAYVPWQRAVAEVGTRLLVTLGGADPGNATSRVLEALGSAPLAEVQARVLIGAANRHADEIRRRAVGLGARVELLSAVPDMPGLMAWADVAIAAAGSTCWELAFMQLPALLVTIAHNQEKIAAHAAEAGIARSLGWDRDMPVSRLAAEIDALRRDGAARDAQRARGRAVVDGQGVRRVVETLLGFPAASRKTSGGPRR